MATAKQTVAALMAYEEVIAKRSTPDDRRASSAAKIEAMGAALDAVIANLTADLREILEGYRNGERGLPTYEELAAIVYGPTSAKLHPIAPPPTSFVAATKGHP